MVEKGGTEVEEEKRGGEEKHRREKKTPNEEDPMGEALKGGESMVRE